MAQASTYGAAYNRLELDGSDAGSPRSVEGGDPYGEVVQVAVGAGSVSGKRIAAVHYADIAIETELVPTGPLADWIRATLGGNLLRHSGAIVEHDQNYRETSRLIFHDAVIHEVEFPALDANRRDPAYLTVRLTPEKTERKAGSGAVQPKNPGMIRSAKQPRISNFQLQIDGLDAKRVSEVGSLVVRQVIGEPMVGEERLYEAPRWLEIEDLVATLPEAKDWYAWRDAFLFKGPGPERSGSLEYLSPDTKDVLARLEFSGLGIHSLVRERSETGAEAVRRVRASMYCGSLSFGPAVAPSPAAAAPDGARMRLTPRSRVDVAVPLGPERALARPDFA
jgi:hypothetical protein